MLAIFLAIYYNGYCLKEIGKIQYSKQKGLKIQ